VTSRVLKLNETSFQNFSTKTVQASVQNGTKLEIFTRQESPYSNSLQESMAVQQFPAFGTRHKMAAISICYGTFSVRVI